MASEGSDKYLNKIESEDEILEILLCIVRGIESLSQTLILLYRNHCNLMLRTF